MSDKEPSAADLLFRIRLLCKSEDICAAVTDIVNTFKALDKTLSNGGQFPAEWVTKANQKQTATTLLYRAQDQVPLQESIVRKGEV